MTRSSLVLFAFVASLMVSTSRAAEPPCKEHKCSERKDAQELPQVTEGFINAPPAEVWRLFTTAEGYKATGVAHADVDLRIGGLIRSHYDPQGKLGDAGTIVNEILTYDPERMLAIRIKEAPAAFPFRNAMRSTWTVLYFAPAGEMTQVRIVGLGYTDDPESQAMKKFFAEGNRMTLDKMAKPYWPKCAVCKAEGDK